jgi:hypothetical protein
MFAEWQMTYASWLDLPYWELEQAVIWNCPPGEQLPIDQLWRGLAEGRLAATGRRVIYEDIPDSLSDRPPKLGDREHIPALAWLDLTIMGSDYDCDLYVVECEDDHPRPIWRQVRIKREDVLAFWGPPAADQQTIKDKGGRPREYDWDSVKEFTLALVKKFGPPGRANKRFPTKADLVAEIMNEWAKRDIHLAEGTVRRYVGEWLAES